MITFTLCLLALIAGYFTYGRLMERVFGPDDRKTPALTKADGVDYIPLPTWKIFMIQFLNIAGLGPIFGAIMGAKFGTSSYLWIVLGSIFAGAVHDYFAGMLSLRHGGESLPEIIGRYLGLTTKQIMRGFTVLLIGVFMIVIGRPLSVFLCLLPFRKITMKSRLFVSWVGLRGAVPIIFATYPVVAGVEGSNIIFNVVFFITIVSLVVQGTTVSFVARLLHLSKPLEKTGNDFGVELPEEIDTDLKDMTITQEMLEEADTLKDMNLPKGTLVMIVKRGDEFLIPNGTLKLHVNDKLLLISEKPKEDEEANSES